MPDSKIMTRGGYMFRILVCDDDREIVRAIELYLSEEGYEVLCAYDGIEAVEAVRRRRFTCWWWIS